MKGKRKKSKQKKTKNKQTKNKKQKIRVTKAVVKVESYVILLTFKVGFLQLIHKASLIFTIEKLTYLLLFLMYSFQVSIIKMKHIQEINESNESNKTNES